MEQTDGNVTHKCAQTDPCILESKTSQTMLEVEDADVQVQPSMCYTENQTQTVLINRISRSSQIFKNTRSNGTQYSVPEIPPQPSVSHGTSYKEQPNTMEKMELSFDEAAELQGYTCTKETYSDIQHLFTSEHLDVILQCLGGITL